MTVQEKTHSLFNVTWTWYGKNDLLIKLTHTSIIYAGLSLKRRLRPDHGDFSDGFLCYAVLEATEREETKGPVLGWKTWYRLYTNTILCYKTDFLLLDCMVPCKNTTVRIISF